MLELKSYTLMELNQMFPNRRNKDQSQSRNMNKKINAQSITRKLDRYNIEYAKTGRGNNTMITIEKINDPFKVYCISEIGLDSSMDFDKLLYAFYLFYHDKDFRWLPDEMIEDRIKAIGVITLSRQSVSRYKKILIKYLGLIRDFGNSENTVYYFAKGKEKKLCTREQYLDAWHLYFKVKDDNDGDYCAAYWEVILKYGGMPHKQNPILECAWTSVQKEYTELFNIVDDSYEIRFGNVERSHEKLLENFELEVFDPSRVPEYEIVRWH